MCDVLRGAAALRTIAAAAMLSCNAAAQVSSEAPAKNTYNFTAVSTSRSRVRGRFDATWQIAPRLSVDAELQVSSVPSLAQALLRFDAGAIRFEAGRGRLSYGDERLLGANRDTAEHSAGWEMARTIVGGERASAELLVGGSRTYGASLQGLFTRFIIAGASVEPYCLRKLAGGSVVARGVRAAGEFRGTAFNVEIAAEGQGRWAGHWELARAIGLGTLTVESNYATPGFDEFFPAVLGRFGNEDPYGWTDTRDEAVNYDLPVSGRVTLSAAYRSYWTASGTYLTGQALVGVSCRSAQWELTAGVGRLTFTRAGDAPRWSPMVTLSHRF